MLRKPQICPAYPSEIPAKVWILQEVTSERWAPDQLNTFFEYICHHFWVGLLLPTPKTDDEYAQKSVQLIRGSSFQSDFFHNLYFSSSDFNKQSWSFSTVISKEMQIIHNFNNKFPYKKINLSIKKKQFLSFKRCFSFEKLNFSVIVHHLRNLLKH